MSTTMGQTLESKEAAAGPLELLGGAGIEAVAAMRGQFVERPQDAASVLVADCRRVQRAGTCFLQLLLATEASLALEGKTLRLTGLNDEIRRDLQDAGMRGWFLELPAGGA